MYTNHGIEVHDMEVALETLKFFEDEYLDLAIYQPKIHKRTEFII